MKKIAFLTASVVSALLASQTFASENTITFKGQVTSETCTVTVNGNPSSPVVLLPSINASELKNGEDSVVNATFDIAVTGCTGNTADSADSKAATVNISTSLQGNKVTENGNLGNLATTDAAENVEIMIKDTALDKKLNFNEGTVIGESDLALIDGAKEASKTFTAQYYASGPVTAGAVEATLQYQVIYN
ncbi:type 1 fimbrial protein [Pantoea anthophila]|uniref:fimbrial protein n=1 Tax=Pantoea anthophila TaxID=470931 RepID=UPI002DB7E3BA|nr:fimbrial protein [Pantoea anthophila]MEB7540292.1 type 1 fimbrial protein [Pantoea anthophila]